MNRNALKAICGLISILSFVFVSLVGAQDGNYFHDDPEDNDIQDSDPAIWQIGTWHGGELDVSNGKIQISDCIGECSVGHWSGEWSRYTDVSFRVQGRATEGDANFALWGRSLGSAGYYGFVNTRGEIGIGDTLAGINTRHRMPFDVDMSVDDVVIKLDFIGDEISMSAWLAGADPVDLPMISFRDSTLTVGTVGAAINAYSGVASGEYEWMELAEIVPGDVDTNDVIDVRDIDRLSTAVRNGSDANRYDVNRDTKVDALDRDMLLTDIMNVWYGDSNLDGEFSSADLVAVFQAGEFEDDIVSNSTWATGDWNGDSEFDSSDFVAAFQQGGYEAGQGIGAATKVVPEPNSKIIWWLACISTIVVFRRQQWSI